MSDFTKNNASKSLEFTIDLLLQRFKTDLPLKELTPFELGKLVGNKEVIVYLKQYLESLR